MRDNEIQQKIASFPQWHYRFDLKGNLTQKTPTSSATGPGRCARGCSANCKTDWPP